MAANGCENCHSTHDAGTKPHLLKRFIFMTGHQGDRKVNDFVRRIRGVILWKPFQFRQMMERIETVLASSGTNPARSVA